MTRGLVLALAAAAACGSEAPKGARASDGLIEIVYVFSPKAEPGRYVDVDLAAVRKGLQDAGTEAEVSEGRWLISGQKVPAVRIRLPFLDGAGGRREEVVTALRQRPEIVKVAWSGDRLLVRSSAPVPVEEVRDVLTRSAFDLTRHDRSDDPGGGYNATFVVAGMERWFEHTIERRLPDIDVTVMSVEQVGPKAR